MPITPTSSHLTPEAVLQQLLAVPLVPVFYHAEAAVARQVLAACYAGGIRAFEFTNRGPNALAVFQELRQFAYESCPALVLGIGTIYRASEAETYIRAGADFVVQPVTTAEVAARCRQHGVAWVPGALTPNEIFQATELGAELVKIFPVSLVGPSYVQALRGPMPGVRLMVTGGVEPTAENLAAWFGAGVSCVGLGSQLFHNAPAGLDSLPARVAALLTGIHPLAA